MRWGLVVRSERDRGLGVQTRAMYEHLHPDATLCVIVPMSGFRSYPDDFPDATVVTLTDDGLNLDQVRQWWADLDVIVSVETLYGLTDAARDDNVRTVIHANPEFVRADDPAPDTWWFPSTWRLDRLPPGEVIPVPAPDVQHLAGDPYSGSLDFLFMNGNKAMADRTGSDSLREAMRRMRQPAKVSSYSQAGPFGKVRPAQGVAFTDNKAAEGRESLYTGRHVLVSPRRYGGLSLPTQEAMASGLAVIMSDVSPNRDWPIIPVEIEPWRHFTMPCGTVELVNVPPGALAAVMDSLSADRHLLRQHMNASLAWAEAHSWAKMTNTYMEAISRAARTPR